MLEKRTIRIPQGQRCGSSQEPIYGWRETPALCAGGLAVHKALPGTRWRWMVTHESSGLALGVIGAMTRARALANMAAALDLPFDWTLDESRTLKALLESRGIVLALRAIGASD
jgi:hypothetical protein